VASGSLIDGGANCGRSGSDVVILYETLLTADETGIVVKNILRPWIVTSSPCPFVLVYLIWIWPHLHRSNWTLIPILYPQIVNDKYSVADLDITDHDLQHSDYHLDSLDVYGDLIPSAHQHVVYCRMVQPSQPDLDTVSPNFGFVPRQHIKNTLDHTTQFARLDTRLT
jgi:hypothetical protein